MEWRIQEAFGRAPYLKKVLTEKYSLTLKSHVSWIDVSKLRRNFWKMAGFLSKAVVPC